MGKPLLQRHLLGVLLSGCLVLGNIAFATEETSVASGETVVETQGSLEIAWIRQQSAEVLQRNSLSVDVRRIGEQEILMAGSAHFAALWTRDFAFASLGALSVGLYEPVKGGLKSLYAYQRKDGLLPRRIGNSSNVMRGLLAKLGVRQKPTRVLKKAEYRSGLGGTPIDSNPLIAWVTEAYVDKTQDTQLLADIWPQMQLSFVWMESNEENGLLVQDAFADWKDVTARKGQVMYTNVIYYRGLVAMQSLARTLGLEEETQVYGEKAEQIREQILTVFWDEDLGIFKDRADDNSGFFSADGNFLAIVFGVTDENQTEKILANSDEKLQDAQSGLYANVDRPYPKSMVPLSIRLVGIRGYSDNTYVYPWNTALYTMAALTYPNEQNINRARQALHALTETVRAYGFQEAYDKDGKPVHRWAHKSEPDFSWFAGLMAFATDQATRAGLQ